MTTPKHTTRRSRATPNVKWSPAIKELFLQSYRRIGIFYPSCHEAGLAAVTVYKYLREDPAFAAEFEEAKIEYANSIEREVQRRGVEGFDEPIYYKGEEVGTIRRFSDRLLELHIKRHDPAYKQAIDIEQRTTVKAQVALDAKAKIDLTKLDDDKLELLEKLLLEAASGSGSA